MGISLESHITREFPFGIVGAVLCAVLCCAVIVIICRK